MSKISKVKNKIILVYPILGWSGELTRHIPLSLLYVASKLVQSSEFEVIIIDNRIFPHTWKEKLLNALKEDPLLVGVSVMSGTPIKNALEISRLTKTYSNASVVWGGPHPTLLPEQTLQEASIDYLIRGYGSKPMLQLSMALANKEKILHTIAGLSFKKDNKIIHVPEEKEFEILDFNHIPYHLLENSLSDYFQVTGDKRVFPLYSSMGCPYQCAFCISPHQYRDIKKKWVSIQAKEVVDHIEYLVKRYSADFIYFYDEDSFVNIQHMSKIMDEIENRHLHIKMGFRGARINEILKMSPEYINRLGRVGTKILHVGIESGSERILKLINKKITLEMIYEVNNKLSEAKEITAAYNFLVGSPTETIEDLILTKNLILKLVKDNPRCIIFAPNKFRPYPGTDMYNLSIKVGFNPPKNLEEWIQIDQIDNYNQSVKLPSATKKEENFIRLLYITSYIVDSKIKFATDSPYPILKIIGRFAALYRPIGLFRMKYEIAAGLFEWWVFKIVQKVVLLFRI